MEKPELLICSCNSAEHQIVIHKDSEDKLLYLHIHLTNRSFFKRLLTAMKYVFGYHCKFGHWEEVILSQDHADQIQKMADFLKK